jgi:hypothetical protein
MLPAIAGVGILTLGACGATEDGAGTNPTADAPAMTESPEPTPTETDDSDDSDDSAMASGGADCIVGEWEGDIEAAERRAVDSLNLGEIAVDPEVSISGDTVIEFDGSTMITEFEDQMTEILLALDGTGGAQEVMVSVRLDGTTEGDYTVDGDRLSITGVDVSGLESEVTAELGGEAYDLPGTESLDRDSYAVDQEFTFTCDDEELRLTPVAPADLEEGTAEPGDETEVDDATQVLTRR